MKKLLLLFGLIFISNLIKAQTKVDTNLSKKNAYKIVEVEAEFPGGLDKLIEFLTRQIKYPMKMQDQNLVGKTQLEFIVCENGSICDARVIKSAGKYFDDEALRVVKSMPNWKPAKQNGKQVSSYYSLPITFDMEADDDVNYKINTLIPIEYADKFVEFKEGEMTMTNFINSNIKINKPTKTICSVLSFNVDKLGNTTNITSINKTIYDNEAIRILKLFPLWQPAVLNNKTVACKMKIAIVFNP